MNGGTESRGEATSGVPGGFPPAERDGDRPGGSGVERRGPLTAGERRRPLTASERRLRAAGLAAVALATLLSIGWLRFEAGVAERFAESLGDAPTRMYSQPLVLRIGDAPDPALVEAHLRAAGVEPDRYTLDGREWWIALPSVRMADRLAPRRTYRVELDADGRLEAIEGHASGPGPSPSGASPGLEDSGPPPGPAEPEPRGAPSEPLRELRLPPALLLTVAGPDGWERTPVQLDEVPEHLVHAVLAVEDRRFHRHRGLDFRRTMAALRANLRAGRVSEGGSTVTQQLVRTLFLSRERTISRKAREAILAVALERRVAKREILEAYLNHVYLGHVSGVGIHGVARAAEAYFDKDVTELEIGESALLAGLIRAPNLYSPFADPETARDRRDLGLAAMRAAGLLDEEAWNRARRAALAVRDRPSAPRFAPYFGDLATRHLALLFPEEDLGRAGLTAPTSLVPGLQWAAERAVREGLEELERRYPRQVGAGGASETAETGDARLQAALVALDPRTGAVLALVGGRDYAASQFNRAADARRQPGSVFKPIVVLAALTAEAHDRDYSLASTFHDAPLTIDTDEGPWSPSNHDGIFRGAVTLRGALVASRNLPFVRLALELGPRPILETAEKLGIRAPLRRVPSLALGASEVSLLEMTAAYGALAAGGVRARPWVVTVAPVDTATKFPAEPVAELTAALEAVVRYGTGHGVRERGYQGPVAAKSGTTDGYRDAWFLGYTPEMAIGVWVGHDDGTSIGLPGNVAALPLFADFLRTALTRDGSPVLPFRPEIEAGGIGPLVGAGR